MADRRWNLFHALRSYWGPPLTAKSPEIAKLWAAQEVSSGVSVNEETALRSSPVWTCVSLIADDIASLPLHFYKRLSNGGKQRYDGHPLYGLLHDSPNPESGSMSFRQTMMGHVLLWGNAYAEIVRDGSGRPIRLWDIEPNRVKPFRDTAGNLRYEVSNAIKAPQYFDAADILHLHGLSWDGVVGYSVVSQARESIGLTIAAEKFGATFYGNGSTFGGVIAYPNDPPEQTKKNNREALQARHQGVEKAHKFLMLYGGAKYERLGIPPNDAQFLETRVFQLREIARWFKLPPHKVGDIEASTRASVEQQNIDYFTSCLRPWLKAWEEELTRKLISPLERRQQFIEHDIKGLLQADSAARAELYKSLFSLGAITPNEIRSLENMDPLPGGDQSFIQLNNMFPLDQAESYAEAMIQKMTGVPEPPDTGTSDTGDQAQEDTSTAEDTAPTRADLQAFVSRLEQQIADQTTQDAERAVKAETQLAVSEAARRDAMTAQAIADETIRTLRATVAETLERVNDAAAQAAEAEAERDSAWQSAKESDKAAGLIAEERDGLVRQVAEVTAGADALKALAESREAQRDEYAARCSTLAAQVEQTSSERDALKAKAETHEALLAELRVHVQDTATLRESLARLEAERDDQAKHAQALSDAHNVLAQSVEAQKRTMARIALAHRGLLVDALERLLQREIDRARKAQSTPEKLRSWAESFYGLHGETCRTVLRPVIDAWAVTSSVDAESVLDRIVHEHIETSRGDILRAADVDDPDEMASHLALVLKRWESERSQRIADRLMGEHYGA